LTFSKLLKKALLDIKSPTLREVGVVTGAEATAKIVSKKPGVKYYLKLDDFNSVHVTFDSLH
jgi:hypothetical protein